MSAARTQKTTEPAQRKRPGPKKRTFTKSEESLLRYFAAETAVHGEARCSKQELAEIVGRSLKTVSRSIVDLRRRGYLEVTMNFDEKGAQLSSSYRVVLDRLPKEQQTEGVLEAAGQTA